MNEQVEQWLKFAYQDLRSAEVLLKEEIYSQTCFHCQQCVEKTFKAVLVHNGLSVPHTHSIVTLSKLLPTALVSVLDGDITIFDDFYIPARYPDTLPGGLPDGPTGKAEADEAILLMRDIFQKINHYLSTQP